MIDTDVRTYYTRIYSSTSRWSDGALMPVVRSVLIQRAFREETTRPRGLVFHLHLEFGVRCSGTSLFNSTTGTDQRSCFRCWSWEDIIPTAAGPVRYCWQVRYQQWYFQVLCMYEVLFSRSCCTPARQSSPSYSVQQYCCCSPVLLFCCMMPACMVAAELASCRMYRIKRIIYMVTSQIPGTSVLLYLEPGLGVILAYQVLRTYWYQTSLCVVCVSSHLFWVHQLGSHRCKEGVTQDKTLFFFLFIDGTTTHTLRGTGCRTELRYSCTTAVWPFLI